MALKQDWLDFSQESSLFDSLLFRIKAEHFHCLDEDDLGSVNAAGDPFEQGKDDPFSPPGDES